MPQLPQRHVTVTITLIADSDDQARETIDAMTMSDGSTLDYEIVDIREVRSPEPETSPGR
jgi:hypothetical protein